MQTAGITQGRSAYVAVPNLLTALRLVLAPVFFKALGTFLALHEGFFAALFVFACICLTDYLDGALARRLGAATRAGAVFDVTVDFIYVLSSVLLLVSFYVVPVWFLPVVVLKLLEFIITSSVLKSRNRTDKPFVFDPAGRAASALFFLLPGICCIVIAFFPAYYAEIVFYNCVGISALAAFSSARRIGSVVKAFN